MATINGGRIEYTIGYSVDQTNLKNLQSQLSKISSMTTKEFLKLNPQIDNRVANQKLKEIQESAKAVEKAILSAYNPKLNTTNLTKLNRELKSLDISKIYKDMSMLGKEGQKAFQEFATSAMTANTTLKKTPTVLDKIGDTLKRTLTWNLSSSVINQLTGKFQEAYGYVKNLDKSLNDIRIVTEKSAEQMDIFAEKANKAAKALGKSTTDYTNASLIYYQQGLSDEETAARTDVTLKAANVTQQSTAEVSEQLTAVWNGYKVSAAEAELYVDKLAAVAAGTASDLEELSTGMSKVASAANLVGMDVDQMNAALATTISVTKQAPESVGTAYKTILARMTTISAGGTDEDGADLTSYTEKMNAFGINVLDSTGKLRQMGDVIEEVGSKWSSMSREAQISLAQVMAGTRQYNNLTALFDNWDMYESALETSKNSAGTLQEQQEIYMQSTAAHLQQLRTASEGVFDSLLDSDDINDFTDVLTKIIEKIEVIIDSVGNLDGVISGLGMVLLSVFNKQVGSTLATMFQNFQNVRNEAKMLKADIENTKLFAQSQGMDDIATKSLVDSTTKLQQYYKIANEGEINRGKEIAKNIAQLETQIALHRADAEISKTFLTSLHGQIKDEQNVGKIDFDNESLLLGSQKSVEKLTGKVQANVDSLKNNLPIEQTEKEKQAYAELSKVISEVTNTIETNNKIIRDNKKAKIDSTEASAAIVAAEEKLQEAENKVKGKISSVTIAYEKAESAIKAYGSASNKAKEARTEATSQINKEIAKIEKLQNSYKEGTAEYQKYAQILEKINKQSVVQNNKRPERLNINQIREIMTVLKEELPPALAETEEKLASANQKMDGSFGQAGEQLRASLQLAKNEFNDLIQTLDMKALGTGISSLGSMLTSIQFTWSTLNSIQEAWADETLTTEERMQRLLSSTGMLLTQIPMLVNNFSAFGSAMKAFKGSIQAMSVKYAENTVMLVANSKATEKSRRVKKMEAAVTDLNNKRKDLANAQQQRELALTAENTAADKAAAIAEADKAVADKAAAVATAEHAVAQYSLGAAIWSTLWPIALAAAAIAGIVLVVRHFIAEQQKAQKAMEDAQKALEKAKEAYSNLAKEISNLESSFDKLKEQKEALSELTKGTEEWEEALNQVKETTEALLEDFPELQKYARYENGQWVLDEEDIEAFLTEKESEKREAAVQAAQAQITANEKELDYRANKVDRKRDKDSNVSTREDFIQLWGLEEGIDENVIDNIVNDSSFFSNLYKNNPESFVVDPLVSGGEDRVREIFNIDSDAVPEYIKNIVDARIGAYNDETASERSNFSGNSEEWNNKILEMLDSEEFRNELISILEEISLIISGENKQNFEQNKVIVQNSEQGQALLEKINSQYEDNPEEANKVSNVAFGLIAQRAQQLDDQDTSEDNIKAYDDLTYDQKSRAQELLVNQLKNSGKENISLNEDNITFTNDSGELETWEFSKYESTLLDLWKNDQKAAQKQAVFNDTAFMGQLNTLIQNAEDNEGYMALVNLVQNPNSLQDTSLNELNSIFNLTDEAIDSVFAAFSNITTPEWEKFLRGQIYKDEETGERQTSFKVFDSEDVLTSQSQRDFWSTLEAREDYGTLTPEEEKSLAESVNQAYMAGGEEGFKALEEEISEKGIKAGLEFEYEEDYKGLTKDLVERLKTIKIDPSTFDNYKKAFEKANEDIADETIVRWLEAQKGLETIAKDSEKIFDSLGSVNFENGISTEQLDNLVNLTDTFETLTGLDLEQDWILDNLDILKNYINGVPGATEQLEKALSDMLEKQNSIAELAFKFNDLDSGETMPEELKNAIINRYQGKEEAQKRIAAAYGYKFDEETKNYIKETEISENVKVILSEENAKSKILDAETIAAMQAEFHQTKEQLAIAIKKIDPNAKCDVDSNFWELDSIIIQQAYEMILTGETPTDTEVELADYNKAVDISNKSYTKIERNTEFDLNYDSWEKMISYKEKELSRLEEAAEQLTGDALLRNLEERKKIYEEINKQREDELAQNEIDLARYEKEVAALGAKIDPETGYILNERDILKSGTDALNAKSAEYNKYIKEDGSLDTALMEADGKSQDDIDEINDSYKNLQKSVSDTKEVIENYNKALDKNIELLEDSIEELKLQAELQATEDIVKVTAAYENFTAASETAAEEATRFQDLLSDDKAVDERIADLTKLGEIQKSELAAYEEQLTSARQAQEELVAGLAEKGIKIELTGNVAKDTKAISDEISSLEESIVNTEDKIKNAVGVEKEKLESTLAQLFEKKSYLEQISEEWERIGGDIDDVNKKIQDMNDALSTSVQEMEELSEWRTGHADKQLEATERQLSRLQSQESRLSGQALINNLNQQKSVVQQQIRLEREKLKVLQAQLKARQAQLKESLRQLAVDAKISVKFEDDGSVNTTSLWNSLNENRENVSDQVREEITSLVDDINGTVSEINSIEDAIFGHEQDILDLQDKMKDAAEQATEKLKEEMSKALEIFNAKVDVEVNIEDAWRQFDRLEKKVDGLRERSTEIFQNALTDYTDAIHYITANPNSYFGDAGGGSVQILTQHVNDIMREIDIMQAGGTSSLYGVDQSTAFGDLENYYGQLMSAVEGFYDSIDAAKQKYSEAIDAMISKNSELLNDFEQIKSLQDHGINLTKLLFGEESFEEQSSYLERQSDVISQQLQAAVEQRDYYKQLLDSIDPVEDEENYNKVKSAYLEAIDAVYGYAEEKLEKLNQQIENSIDANRVAMQESLAANAGFGSAAQMNRDWEYKLKVDEDYLDTTNTQYEIESLTNKFNEAISGADSLSAKEKITDVMNEQLDILNEQLEKGQKLTKYDIERANKVYELTLKQIALEEAQENKSKMRLRRDSQGNYRYEYVADQENINNAKQELLDAQNDLYNFDKERAKTMVQELTELTNSYYEAQKAIIDDLTLTEEQKDAELLALQERYWGEGGLITMAKEEYLQASGNAKDLATEELTLFDQTIGETLAGSWQAMVDNIKIQTDELIIKCQEQTKVIEETMQVTTDGAANLESAIIADTIAMEELVAQDEELLEQYDQQIEAIQELMVELQALEAQYKAVMDAAMAAVEQALLLRQTSWETETEAEENTNSSNNVNGNSGGIQAGVNSGDSKKEPSGITVYKGLKGDYSGIYYFKRSTVESKGISTSTLKRAAAADGMDFAIVDSVKAPNTFVTEMNGSPVPDKHVIKGYLSLLGFDTGGYTGAWGSEGRMAMLHEKELVLNKVDTANILQAVDIVRTVSSDLAALQAAVSKNMISQLIGNNPSASGTLEQNVKIEAHFPNVSSSSEIEQAFNNLVNLASQRAMRK